jgi:hypothetical protein
MTRVGPGTKSSNYSWHPRRITLMTRSWLRWHGCGEIRPFSGNDHPAGFDLGDKPEHRQTISVNVFPTLPCLEYPVDSDVGSTDWAASVAPAL